MQQALMSVAQLGMGRATALWSLDRGQAERLDIGSRGQFLRVVEGWLWLTGDASDGRPSEDIWLAPGEEMHLPAGSSWVVEARDAGRFQLLLPRQAPCWSAWRALGSAWRRWWRTGSALGQRA